MEHKLSNRPRGVERGAGKAAQPTPDAQKGAGPAAGGEGGAITEPIVLPVAGVAHVPNGAPVGRGLPGGSPFVES